MGAQLNIKSEDAYRLASRLSELTGEKRPSAGPFPKGRNFH